MMHRCLLSPESVPTCSGLPLWRPSACGRARTQRLAATVLIVLTALCATAAAAPRERAFRLAAGQKPEAVIVRGANAGPVESTAVQALVSGLQREGAGALAVSEQEPPDAKPLIVVGTTSSNALQARLTRELSLPVDQLTSESFLLRTVRQGGRDCLLILGHDERGVLYGVQEALDQVITSMPGGDVLVTACDTLRKPALPVRGTYSLTCWGLAPRYDRAGWEAAIDSMAAAGMNRIMFWMDGLFRSRKQPYTFLENSYYTGVKLTDDDIHSLIRYAHDRGMEFKLGSGVFGWFTSGTFAEKFKEAADHSGSNLCPSHPLARRLTLEYLAEMMDVFPEADGYMLEIRDEIRDCMCATCQKPLDAFGSKQFGQSELDLLEQLTQTVWRNHPKAKFIWLIGYDNHPNDSMYYERIRRMGRDPRMEWLEVRGSWMLPAAGGTKKPLSYFSDRAYVWGGGYYAMSADSIQQLVQRILKAGLRGYLPAYEPGFGTACIYGQRVPYPVDLIPFVLTQFYYRTFTWEPDITPADLLARAHRRFFSDDVPADLADDLLFLRRFMQAHYPELTCIAPGLIRTSTLAEGVEQIWSDSHMPDKKAKLTQLAERVRSLQELARGGGDMARLTQIEERIDQLHGSASRRSAAAFALMQTAIDDIRKTLAGRQADIAAADDTLARIDARIAEYLKNQSASKPRADSSSPGAGPPVAEHGPIRIDAPIAQQLFRLRLRHAELDGGLCFMFFEHANASAIKGFPGPTRLESPASDRLKLVSEAPMARWEMTLRAVDDGVELRLTVQNTSQQSWPGFAGLEACLSPRWPNNEDRPVRFIGRASARDEVLQPLSDRELRRRTYILIGDRPELLKEMGICYRDAETYNAVTADENWMSTWWNKTYPVDPRHPEAGVLIRRDADTGWVMSFAWDDWVHLKTHDVYDCLHVAPRIGPLAPGESKIIRGKLGLFRATMAEGIAKARPVREVAARGNGG